MIFRPWSNWARAEPTVLQLLWTNRDPDGGLVLVEGETVDGRPEVASPREPLLCQICNECVSARVGVGVGIRPQGVEFRCSFFGLLVSGLRFRNSDHGAGSRSLGVRICGGQSGPVHTVGFADRSIHRENRFFASCATNVFLQFLGSGVRVS